MIEAKRIRQRITYLLMLFVLLCPFVLRFTGEGKLLSSVLGIIGIFVFLVICSVINFKAINKRDWIILLVSLFFLFVSVIINKSYGVVVTFLNMSLFLLVLNNVSFSIRQVELIRLITIVLLYLLITSFKFRKKYGVLWVYDGYDELNLNTYGLLLFMLYLNLACFLDLIIKKRLIKGIIFVGLTVFSLYNIWETACRSAIVSLIFFCGLLLVDRCNYKKVLLVLVFAGLLVPVFYISLYEILGSIEFLGKSLYTGREIVWLNTWEAIKSSIILGSGTGVGILSVDGELTDSAHNIYLGFWKTVGIVPMLSFVWFLLRGRNSATVTPQNLVAKKAFLCCMVVCMVETLINDSNFNFLVMLLLINVENSRSSRERVLR